MGKIQGQRVGSIKKLKQKLQGGGGAGFIKYVPKEGSIMVRFLTEPDDFFGYWEHYDSTIRRSYACVESDCPGCATDEERHFIYLGNVLTLEDDKVVPFQLKRSVVNDLVLRYEKYGTITDRDYEIGKTGEGKNTRYYVSPEPPKGRKLSKYDLHDLEAVVEAAFEENTKLLNPDDDDDDEDEKPVKKAAAKAPAGARTPPPKKAPAKKAAAKRPKKPEPEKITYTAEELDAMDEDELTAAAESVGVDTDAFEDWDEVMEAILEAAGEDSDDEAEPDDDDDSDDDDDEDDVDDEDDDDEDEEATAEDDGDFWTEAELKAKTPGELKAIAKDYDIATKGLRPAQIIEKLLNA